MAIFKILVVILSLNLTAHAVVIDNVKISGNTVSTLNTNGDLTFDMNGTGALIFGDLTATTVPYLDASKKLTSSAATPTHLTYLSNATSNLCGISQSCTLTNKTLTSPVISSPTGIVKGDVGLGNVDNTADADKPVSSATQTALNLKANIASPTLTGTVTLPLSTAGLVTTTSGGVISSTATASIAQGGTNNGSLGVTAGGVVYTDGSKLVNVGAGSSGQILTSQGSSAPTWSTSASAPSYSAELSNCSLAASVGSSALTVALKDGSGSDASGGSACKIGFRSSTIGSGAYNQRSVTGALSVVVSSGSTLGHTNGIAWPIYVYAIDNSGTVELAVSSALYKEGSLVSTTAEGGAGAADTYTTIYSTTSRSSVPMRLIGRLTSNQTTAGTYAAVPTIIELVPFDTLPITSNSTRGERIERLRFSNGSAGSCTSSPCTIDFQSGSWATSVTRGSTGTYTLNVATGMFSSAPTCVCSAYDTVAGGASMMCAVGPSPSTTSVSIGTFRSGTGLTDAVVNVICMGPR